MFKPRVPDADPAPQDKPEEVDFMRLMLGWRTELAHSLSGVLLRGARPVPIGISPGATANVLTSPGRLVGWSITEAGTPSAVAKVSLYDGDPAAGGLLVASVPLTAGQNNTQSFNPGVGVVRGIFAVVSTGTVEGSVWVGEVD